MNAAQVQALIRMGLPMAEDIDFRVERLDERHALARIPFHGKLVRPGGTLSGPTIMALADAAMYADEPCHGSAPDIAGQGIANPLATILSVSMMLRYSFSQATAADAIEQAVSKVLDQGLRTGDIWSEGCRKVGTREMGDAVVAALKNL